MYFNTIITTFLRRTKNVLFILNIVYIYMYMLYMCIIYIYIYKLIQKYFIFTFSKLNAKSFISVLIDKWQVE